MRPVLHRHAIWREYLRGAGETAREGIKGQSCAQGMKDKKDRLDDFSSARGKCTSISRTGMRMCYPHNCQDDGEGEEEEGGGGVVTRRRVDRVISLSYNTYNMIYVFTHALAYHPLSEDDDDATLQMNPITHQGGRPSQPHIPPAPCLSLSLPAAEIFHPDCSGGSMNDGRTPFFAPPPTIRPSTLIPFSCPLIRITPESSSLKCSQKLPFSSCSHKLQKLNTCVEKKVSEVSE